MPKHDNQPNKVGAVGGEDATRGRDMIRDGRNTKHDNPSNEAGQRKVETVQEAEAPQIFYLI